MPKADDALEVENFFFEFEPSMIRILFSFLPLKTLFDDKGFQYDSSGT